MEDRVHELIFFNSWIIEVSRKNLTLSRKISTHSNDIIVNGIDSQAINFRRRLERCSSDLEIGQDMMMLLDKLGKWIYDVDAPSIIFVNFL